VPTNLPVVSPREDALAENSEEPLRRLLAVLVVLPDVWQRESVSSRDVVLVNNVVLPVKLPVN
jgi:hypothetical protein